MHYVRERESAQRIDGTVASRREGIPRRSSHPGGRHRSPHRRIHRYLVGTLVTAVLLGFTAHLLDGRRNDASSAAPRLPGTVHTTPTSTPTPTSPPTKMHVPTRGTGTFVTADGSGAKAGHGSHPLRYTVKVETGLDISPSQAANEIADILAAPRGWTHNGVNSFLLVGAGEPSDLEVKIATPGTADTLCWEGIHQDTQGEYNCEIPNGVVVNLKRWVKGSPTFDGSIHDYRALIINHEMGHFLGYTHMTCAGPGQLAPVMMQQIKGLHGCIANAWPYDSSGHLVAGPHVQ
ncbi:DUF3152 domain-containing protein [Streptomyces sp. NPDC046870]|uniref:DUF3152 domain-containing protein n=1 Tax=Streptomyces sp. NPDC046870 TaxID=3155135 RepID=UPI003453600D